MSYYPQDYGQGYPAYGYPTQGYVYDSTQQAQQSQAQQGYAYPQWQQAAQLAASQQQTPTQTQLQQQQLQHIQQQTQQIQQQQLQQIQQLQQQQQQQQQRHAKFGSHKPAKNPKDTVSIHCDICELNCLGQDAYNAHMVGRKHAAAAKRKAASEGGDRYAPYSAPGAQGGPPQKPATGKFFCELCHIYSTDQNTFDLHLNGRKHFAAAQAAQKNAGAAHTPPANAVPVSPVTTAAPPTPTPTPTPTTQAPFAPPPNPPPSTAPATPPAQPSNLTPTNPAPTSPAPSTFIPPSPTIPNSPTSNSPQVTPNIPPTITIPPSPASTPTPTPSPKSRPGPFRRGYNRGGGGGGPYGRYNKNTHVNSMPIGKNNNNNNTNNNNTFRTQTSTPNNAPRSPPSTLSMGPSNSNDDNLLSAKHAELSPSAASAMALAALVRSVSNKLNEIGKKTSEDGVEVTPKVVVSETKLVGSYAKGTMLKGNLCADIVAITQAPPTHATLEVLYRALTSSVPEAKVTLHLESSQIHVQENDYNTHIMVTWLGAWSAKQDKDGVIRIEHSESEQMDSHGTTVTTSTTVVTAVTTATEQAQGTSDAPAEDSEMKLDLEVVPAVSQAVVPTKQEDNSLNIEACQGALLSIRQMMWFNDHQMSPNIRSVMRLMLDFRSRNEVFQVLTPWTTEIIVAHALRTNPPNSSISQSLRSVFAYMASGVLLPGIELIDPCQQEPVNVLSSLSAEERLGVTALAQELIRDIAYGKWERVVGTS